MLSSSYISKESLSILPKDLISKGKAIVLQEVYLIIILALLDYSSSTSIDKAVFLGYKRSFS